MSLDALSISTIGPCIYQIRGSQVILDHDLAKFYQIKTKNLKKAVRRNHDRFPSDFMFELTKEEYEILKFQTGASKIGDLDENRGGDRFIPFVFTEPGVAMLSSVLRNARAIEVNIAIMRTFVQLRRQRDLQVVSLQQFENKLLEMSHRIERFEDEAKNLKPDLPFVGCRRTGAAVSWVAMDTKMGVFQIQEQVLEHVQLNVKDLRSQSRGREIVFARQVIMYLIRETLGLSFRDIGTYFGKKDHTTALHAYRKIQREMQKNDKIRLIVESIQQNLTPSTSERLN